MTKTLFVTLLLAAGVLVVLFLVESVIHHSGWSFVMVLVVGGAAVSLVRHYVASRSR
ncbi:MAG: hypothetical protein M3N46_08410 [Actinomycetota bacterium]|nr:hypothetical protein [Actinomycetota bacterium]